MFIKQCRRIHDMKKCVKVVFGGLLGACVLSFIAVSLLTDSDLTPDWHTNLHIARSGPTRGIAKKNFLLLTTWRSGSSWIGKLLEATPSTFYLFEPLFSLKDPSLHDYGLGIPPRKAIDLLKQLYQCSIGPKVGEFARKWPLLYNHIRDCPEATCKLDQFMLEKCHTSLNTFIKTVRFRLGSAEELLAKPSLNPLKIIYLARDPRGILNSMSRYNWHLTPAQICFKLRDDAYTYQMMHEIYPGQLMFLRYEDILLDTPAMAQRLWDFITDTTGQPLPEAWNSYLVDVPFGPIGKANPAEARRKTRKDWQSWRYTIPEHIWAGVEEYCPDIMTQFGYVPFTSFKEVQDMTNISLAVFPCVLPPCVS